MDGLVVTLYAKTASFRDPGAQLYHETLPLPPPSTIVGIAGAALGLGFEDVLEYFKENEIMVGCIGTSGGSGKDLWNYIKIKNKESTHAIILRNFLSHVRVEIFYACENSDVVKRLYEGFQNPFYAITLGNSDEIAKICSVEIIRNISSSKNKIFNNTWIRGDYSRKIQIDWEFVKKSKINVTIKPPMVKKLPCDYEFDSIGARKATKYKDISFVGKNCVLEMEAEVFMFEDKPVSMLQI